MWDGPFNQETSKYSSPLTVRDCEEEALLAGRFRGRSSAEGRPVPPIRASSMRRPARRRRRRRRWAAQPAMAATYSVTVAVTLRPTASELSETAPAPAAGSPSGPADRHTLSHCRHTTVTLPSHHCTVTLPSHYHHTTVTFITDYGHTTGKLQPHYLCHATVMDPHIAVISHSRHRHIAVTSLSHCRHNKISPHCRQYKPRELLTTTVPQTTVAVKSAG